MYWRCMVHVAVYLSIKLMCKDHTPRGPRYQHDPTTHAQTGHTCAHILAHGGTLYNPCLTYLWKISATVTTVSTCQLSTQTSIVESSVISAAADPLSSKCLWHIVLGEGSTLSTERLEERELCWREEERQEEGHSVICLERKCTLGVERKHNKFLSVLLIHNVELPYIAWRERSF